MARKNSEVKVKFVAETQDINNGLKSTQNEIKVLNSQLSLNAEKLKGASGDTNLLSERTNLLSNALAETQKKTELMNEKLQKAKELFGEETKTKFRPHHFPFTEPSAEVDVTCFKCGGKGCRFCKGSGWIEILGCGMVHPHVLEMCGIDPEEYSGFAFGVGLERIALLKYEIDDMRLLYENDIRFLKQF